MRCVPKKDIEVLTPRTSECDLTLFGNKVTADVISSDEVITEDTRSLIHQDSCSYEKKEVGTQTQTHTGSTHVRTEETLEGCNHMPRNTQA